MKRRHAGSLWGTGSQGLQGENAVQHGNAPWIPAAAVGEVAVAQLRQQWNAIGARSKYTLGPSWFWKILGSRCLSFPICERGLREGSGETRPGGPQQQPGTHRPGTAVPRVEGLLALDPAAFPPLRSRGPTPLTSRSSSVK